MPDLKIDKKKYDVMFFERNTGLLEHILLLSLIKSYRFYTQVKNRLCPRLPDGRSFRPDFTRLDFNHVYSVVAQFWESIGIAVKKGDMSIGHELMDLILAHQVTKGLMTAEDVRMIEDTWLTNDIKTIEIAPELIASLPGNPMFLQWLEIRAVSYEHSRLTHVSLGHAPTLDDLHTSLKEVQKSVISPASQIVNAGTLVDSSMMFSAAMSTSLPNMDRMYGGGFRLRDTTVIAAISGGGKTVMAMQLARDYTCSGIDTIVLTTEQPPYQMLPRLISNHMTLDYALFLNRVKGAVESPSMANVPMPFAPPECWSTQDRWDAMKALKLQLDKHLLFIDWSEGGFTLEKDFNTAIDMAISQHPGFDPKVIIVDWVGGGLDYSNMRGDQLRHFFKAAGETIISHGKRNHRIMIMTAQLNKTLARPHSTYITMDMLAECKSLVDNAANFMGITALREEKEDHSMSLRPLQFLCADKSRHGITGKAKVMAAFQYQRFQTPTPTFHGGDAGEVKFSKTSS